MSDTIDLILADARNGIDVRHRATLLGHCLGGDTRTTLYQDIVLIRMDLVRQKRKCAHCHGGGAISPVGIKGSVVMLHPTCTAGYMESISK